MAIELPIPKDIRKYETKLIGPLTTRQTICIVPACALGALAYITLSKIAPRDLAMFACMLVIVPFIVFGWFKPYGIPLEKFLKTVFVTMVLAPKNRIYKTKNIFATMSPSKTNATATKKKNKKKPDYKSKIPDNVSFK